MMQKKPSGQGAESNGSSTERPADAPDAPGAREPDGAGRSQSDVPAGAAAPEPGPSEEDRFPIVGVGASAGGLAAFEAFLSALPSDTGMAFVFRSLAKDQGDRAIGIVLSGTGTDGSLGARAIKGEGGLVLAQAPTTAAYDGMPRPVGDIVSNLADYADLEADVHAVVDTLAPQEKEVHTRQGVWYLMRIGPYRTLENVIEGAVITFVDISRHKALEAELRRTHAYAEAIVDTVREPLLVLDREQRVLSANSSFYRHFDMAPAQVEGRLLRVLGEGQWDLPALRQRLAALQADGGKVEDMQVELDFPRLGRRSLLLNARLLDAAADRAGAILLAIEDDTANDHGASRATPDDETSSRP